MSRLPRIFIAVAIALFLGGCVLALPGSKSGGEPAASPITGGDIEVTTLEDAPAAAHTGPTSDRANDTATAIKPVQETTPAKDAALDPAPNEPAAAPAPAEAVSPPPVDAPISTILAEPKSPQQSACEKKGGAWTKVGKTSAQACILRTRDGGKRCTNETQCDGECLARSGTCSPIKPLLGCNEVLQANGAMVTLCIE